MMCKLVQSCPNSVSIRNKPTLHVDPLIFTTINRDAEIMKLDNSMIILQSLPSNSITN